MFLQNKFTILLLAFSAFIILLMQSTLACAHIEKGQMPDPLAIMEYRILLEFEPDNLEVRNMLGMALYRQEKLDEAEQEFNFVLALDPQNFDAIDALGLVKMKQGKLDHAVDLFKKAIYINADDMLVHYHLGLALELLGDADSAARAYRSALDKKPSEDQGEWYLEQQQELIEALKNIGVKQKESSVSR
jgi:Tfp pilus assembly protein PilF